MIHSWGDHIGKRTAWSFIYFLIYAYLNILAQSQILFISLYVFYYVCVRFFNISNLCTAWTVVKFYQIWCCRPSFLAQKFQPPSGQKFHSMNKKRAKNTKLDRKLTTLAVFVNSKMWPTFFHNFEEIFAISIIY